MPMLFLSGATVPVGDAAQVGADPGASSCRHRTWSAASRASSSAIRISGDNAAGRRRPAAHHGARPVPGRAAFPLGEGRKNPPRNKLWVLAVLAPFLLMGCAAAYSKEHLGQNQALYRDLQRSGTFLIRNARIFVGRWQSHRERLRAGARRQDRRGLRRRRRPIPTSSKPRSWKARARRCCPA